MGDCMSYPDKAIDFIKGYSFKDKQELYTNGAELVPMFRVEQMLEHYLSRWISVSERLPEEPPEGMIDMDDLEEYIVTINGANGATTLQYAGDGEWWDAITEGYYVIDAWMPLPESYKPH